VTSLDARNDDFRDMVALLCDEGAEFLIVGGYAVAFHGHPRATGDLDLLVRPTPENATRVWRALLLGFDSLVANKRASGRPKDLVDVQEPQRRAKGRKSKPG
jgi:hypothetical protein